MDFADLWKFRNILILKELLYIVVTKMPKAEFPKIKGLICNVPKDVGGICKIVPRGMDTNSVLRFCLKNKFNNKSHVCFEPVRPKVIWCS